MIKKTSQYSFVILLVVITIIFFQLPSLAIVRNWAFDTTSNYTFEAHEIQILNSEAMLYPTNQDQDNSDYGFGGGIKTNVEWDEDSLILTSGNNSGDFISRIMTAPSDTFQWESISWAPNAPYGKELPNNGISETGYPEDNANMSGCVFLAHINENPAIHNTLIIDSSGNGHNGTLKTSDESTNKSVTGKFNRAIDFDGINSIEGDIIVGPPSNTITGNNLQTITMASWIKSTSQSNSYIMSLKRSTGYSTLMSLTLNYGGVGNLGFLAVNTSGTHTSLTYNGNYNDGNWHHIVGVINGLDRQVFVDGVLVATSSDGLQSVTNNTAPFTIGGFSENYTSLHFDGTIDECAIFNRALSTEEVLSLYKRGALNLKFQVRTDITGDFVGPDGTNNSYYSELENTTPMPPTNISLISIPSSQTFQYKCYFETDDLTFKPSLSSASLHPNTYSSNNPTIQPNQFYYQGFTTLASFEETATKNNGEIKYIISNDQGQNWLYWSSNSSSWETSNELYAQSNTASEISNNLSSFPTGNGQFLFKSFLHSDGTQEVTLSNVSIDYSGFTLNYYSPTEEAGDVSTESIVIVNFNRDMNIHLIQNSFSLEAIYNNNGESINLGISGTFSWEGQSNFTFIPSQPLDYGYTYKVTLNDEGLDFTKTWYFWTIFDYSNKNVFRSSDGKAKVILEKDAFKKDGSVEINRDPTNNPREVNPISIVVANNKAIDEGNPFHFPIESSITEFNAYDLFGNRITDNFDSEVYIYLYYTDDNSDGYVDNTSPAIKAEDLLIYWLDEVNSLWVRVPNSTVNTIQKYVRAPIKHFSVYTLMSTPALNLSSAYAFPVPFKPSEGHTQITFTNLASQCVIRIFNIKGELIHSLTENDGDGQYSWNASNSSGAALASGVYLYHIQSSDDIKTGKIVIIR